MSPLFLQRYYTQLTMSQLSEGALAPDFALADAAGRSHRLSQALRDGPVVLAFYKASCPTCQFAFPFIQKIFANPRIKPADGHRPPLQFWGISQDDAAETQQFAEEYGIGFDLLIDEHPYAVSSTYGLEFVPAIFIVGADGKIALSDFGFTKSSLNRIAGFDFFSADDGLPAIRPG